MPTYYQVIDLDAEDDDDDDDDARHPAVGRALALDEPDAVELAPESPRGPSKSQIKRDKLALQALAERMATAMPRAELERLRLSAATWAALDETARIRDPRARGRHWKRIANLLEREDMAAVHALMDGAAERERAEAARHHAVEDWRARLLAGSDADADRVLTAFITACPAVDRQALRALIRAARRDAQRGRTDAARRLFRVLRAALEPELED